MTKPQLSKLRSEVENLTTWLMPIDKRKTKEAKAGEQLRTTIVNQILDLLATQIPTRQSIIEQIRSELPKKRPVDRNSPQREITAAHIGYNQALADLRTKLNKLGEGK